MNRRKFIASGSSIGAISLSGCLDIFRRNDNEPSNEYPELPSEERVDTPPYEITTPTNHEDEWNPHYLGQNLAENPTRNFSTDVNATLRDQKIRIEDMIESNEYLVRIIDDEEDLNNILNPNDNFNINFDDEILIVVESGFNSSSLMHQWRRVEDTPDGIQIHGYMYRPYDRRLDFESRSSIIRVDKPDNLETAYVSLTIDSEFRINFNSSEGIVRIPVIA